MGRALRSFSTAFLTVAFPLYLARLHEPAATIGLVLTGVGIITAGLVAGVGVVGDRLGRRPVMIGVGLLGALGAFGLVMSSNLGVVVVASALGGIGRGGGAGSGGAFGPFFPVEQPLLAGSVAPSERTKVFGRIGFVGVLAAAAGSPVAGLTTLLHHGGTSWEDAYKTVFLIGAVVSLAVAATSVPLREHRQARRSAEGTGPGQVSPPANVGPAGLSTRQLVSRFAFTNALNGLGFGFLGPLLTYWFYVRFGAGPAEVGLLYTVVNLVSAVPFLSAHRLTSRLGAVLTVVVTRSASVVVLLAMAFMPGFVLAGIMLSLRTIFNSLGVPARQSYTMGATDERHRGTVASLSALPSMVTSSISPSIGGAVMGAFVDVPIIGAAVFMGANTLTYYLAFRHAPLPGERQGASQRSRASGSPADDQSASVSAAGKT
jgi:MFS family permease